MPSVFILLASETPLANEAFAELPLRAGDNAARLLGRACEKFGWGVPSRCRLYLVRGGRERALAVEADPSLAASILVSANKLADDERVEPGSWLLARVPPPPAAAPGASRRRVLVRLRDSTPMTPPPVAASLPHSFPRLQLSILRLYLRASRRGLYRSTARAAAAYPLRRPPLVILSTRCQAARRRGCLYVKALP